MVQRVQHGHVFPGKNTAGKIASWHVRYRTIEVRDGKRVRVLKSHKLCDAIKPDGKKDEHYWLSKGDKGTPDKALQDVCDSFMRGISPTPKKDMSVHEFWEKTCLPFIQQNKKHRPSTATFKSGISISTSTLPRTLYRIIRPTSVHSSCSG